MTIESLFKPIDRLNYWLVCAAILASAFGLGAIAQTLDKFELGVVGEALGSVEFGTFFTLIWSLAWAWPIIARLADLRWSWLWAVIPVGASAWCFVWAAQNPDAELGTGLAYLGGLVGLFPFVSLIGVLPGAEPSSRPSTPPALTP